MNVLRLGDQVRTRGEVPVKKLRVAGFTYAATLGGRVAELNDDHVRVAVSDWGAAGPYNGPELPPTRFAYGDLERV